MTRRNIHHRSKLTRSGQKSRPPIDIASEIASLFTHEACHRLMQRHANIQGNRANHVVISCVMGGNREFTTPSSSCFFPSPMDGGGRAHYRRQ